MNFLYCAVVLLIAVASVKADVWTSCSTSADKFQIKSIDVNPDPPVAGKEVKFNVTGEMSETVNNGTSTVQIQYNGVTIYSQTTNLCTEMKEINSKCPIKEGPYSHVDKLSIPKSVLPGDYTAHVTLDDNDGNEITCLNIDVTLQ
eukprot:TRINITY_DN882_c1_g1_i1.p1 TRINITY_DN882_c1_g1~~TRINITY_DN882_c1_g1_i1.p1  ORF type:complete len:167 (-),score=39.65 TRINITY_DN882_c1_g1_i1:85-519(-)